MVQEKKPIMERGAREQRLNLPATFQNKLKLLTVHCDEFFAEMTASLHVASAFIFIADV